MIILWLICLVVIILAAYWYESSPWRYCRECETFWHQENGKRSRLMPVECDGLVKTRTCLECTKISQAQKPPPLTMAQEHAAIS